MFILSRAEKVIMLHDVVISTIVLKLIGHWIFLGIEPKFQWHIILNFLPLKIIVINPFI